MSALRILRNLALAAAAYRVARDLAAAGKNPALSCAFAPVESVVERVAPDLPREQRRLIAIDAIRTAAAINITATFWALVFALERLFRLRQ